MENFFPPVFWPTVSIVALVAFSFLGLDLMLGAKFISWAGRSANKKFHIDDHVIQMLESLKKTSDQEYNVDHSLMHGWGRFVAGAILLGCALSIYINVLPRFHK